MSALGVGMSARTWTRVPSRRSGPTCQMRAHDQAVSFHTPSGDDVAVVGGQVAVDPDCDFVVIGPEAPQRVVAFVFAQDDAVVVLEILGLGWGSVSVADSRGRRTPRGGCGTTVWRSTANLAGTRRGCRYRRWCRRYSAAAGTARVRPARGDADAQNWATSGAMCARPRPTLAWTRMRPTSSPCSESESSSSVSSAAMTADPAA